MPNNWDGIPQLHVYLKVNNLQIYVRCHWSVVLEPGRQLMQKYHACGGAIADFLCGEKNIDKVTKTNMMFQIMRNLVGHTIPPTHIIDMTLKGLTEVKEGGGGEGGERAEFGLAQIQDIR